MRSINALIFSIGLLTVATTNASARILLCNLDKTVTLKKEGNSEIDKTLGLNGKPTSVRLTIVLDANKITARGALFGLAIETELHPMKAKGLANTPSKSDFYFANDNLGISLIQLFMQSPSLRIRYHRITDFDGTPYIFEGTCV